MRIRFDVDCTPEEARAFFGLPDVTALQKDVLDKLRARLLGNIDLVDMESLFKTWMPAGVEGWEQMMKSFWGQMGATKKGK